jgi:hypothetical protein
LAGIRLHHDTTVLLLVDPLERDPPKAALPFATDEHRVELDLARCAATPSVGVASSSRPSRPGVQALPARGVRVETLSTDAASDAWLGAMGAARRRAWPDMRTPARPRCCAMVHGAPATAWVAARARLVAPCSPRSS